MTHHDGRGSATLPHLAGLRICLVTEELAGFGKSGGIGSAILELATALARFGAQTEIMFLPVAPLAPGQAEQARTQVALGGCALLVVDPALYVWPELGPEKRSYCIYRALQETDEPYDVVHFHDYKGLGFYAQNAKRQGLDFAGTTMVVQAHGPVRWTLDVSHALFSHVDQLKIDFMEQRSIALADWLVSPSQYLIDWLGAHGFALPPPERVRVIRNACGLAVRAGRLERADDPADTVRAGEIILFARHEDRKGVLEFCDALDLLNPLLTRRRVQVTLLGPLGDIGGHPSGIVLTRRARSWTFPLSIRSGFDRALALRYLERAHGAVVVVPSHEENSPYSVVEAALAGRPVITSAAGGARELIHASLHDALLCEINPAALAQAIRIAVEHGLPVARLAETAEQTALAWRQLHLDAKPSPTRPKSARTRRQPAVAAAQPAQAAPEIVLGITHHDRPAKLMEAIISGLRQTYANTKIIVVDDGSRQTDTHARLDQIEVLLARCGGRLIRRANGYLGAARNEILRATDAEYVVFLDDDDLAMPSMIETLMQAAVATGADIVTCFNLFMEAKDRANHTADPAAFEGKLSYAPLGGPLSAAAMENCLGAATTLFRRSALLRLGGYTELVNVGHEDYELYVRALQAGMSIEVVPRPLYLYETGRPSMISRTSVHRNFQRVGAAIDLGSQPAAWKDALTLLTAQSAIAQNVNRRTWEYSCDPHRDLLSRILKSHGRAHDETAELLAEYSDALGARDLARAWRESTDVFLPVDDVCEAAPSSMDWALSEILLLLAGQQGRLAAEQCLARLRETSSVEEPLLSIIDRVVGGLDATDGRDLLVQLADAVARAKVSAGLRSKQLLVILHAAHRTKDAGQEDLLLREAYAADEADYLAAYPDIRRAIGKTELRSGLHHYLISGRREGRSGFATLTAAARTLHDEASDGLASLARRLDVMPRLNGVANMTREAPAPALLEAGAEAWVPIIAIAPLTEHAD